MIICFYRKNKELFIENVNKEEPPHISVPFLAIMRYNDTRDFIGNCLLRKRREGVR